MDARDCRQTRPSPGCCPFFQQAKADWIYPVDGCCRGLPQGLLMIPSIDEYRTLCSTSHHTDCLIYRYRQGEEGLASLGSLWGRLGLAWPARDVCDRVLSRAD